MWIGGRQVLEIRRLWIKRRLMARDGRVFDGDFCLR